MALIPETLERTTLGKAAVGDRLNLEADVLTKTVVRQVGRLASQLLAGQAKALPKEAVGGDIGVVDDGGVGGGDGA